MKTFNLIIIVLSSLIIFSCGKDKKIAVTPNNNIDSTDTTDSVSNISTNTPYTITHTGNLWIKQTITFQTDAPSGSDLSWSFGDNTTSSDVSPTKMYNKVDTFVVTLVVDNDTLNPIRDTLIIGCGYQEFEGDKNFYRVKTWHVVENNIMTVDTVFFGPITMGIVPNNDTSFWFNGDLFEYSPQSNSGYIEYTEKYFPYTTFKFFPGNDSISYFGITPVNNGTQGAIYDKMHTQ